MTNRQRILSALTGEPVDRFPVVTYNFHPFGGDPWRLDESGRYIGPEPYQVLMDTVFATGTGMLCKVTGKTNSMRDEATVGEARMDGSRVVRTTSLQTPRGGLSGVYVTEPGKPGYNVKHFIETNEDLDRFESLPVNTVDVDLSRAIETAERIGDHGIAYLAYPDPMYSVAAMFDFEFFCLVCSEDLDRIVALVDREHVSIIQTLRSMLEQSSDTTFLYYTAGPEILAPPMASPALFERLVVPYETELVRMIREAGQFSSLHCHGRVAEVIELARSIGPHVLEPMEPPPQGDITLTDAMRLAASDFCLMGYIQDQELYTAKPGELAGRVGEIIRTVGDGTGYIMTSSASPFSIGAASGVYAELLRVSRSRSKPFLT